MNPLKYYWPCSLTLSGPAHAVYVETMKSLGYPRPISMDGFRSPNFELVADCLQWLIHR